jgi:RNA polymerase sigma-70 factor (ECF subfamily)
VSVRSPADYLFRIAVNVARDRRKRDSRLLGEAEIAGIMDIPDEGPDPSMVVESRSEFEEFEKALAELPDRRRKVFLAAHLEQLPHRDIAQRFGVNVRTVEFDLQYAMEHLSRRLGRQVTRRFGPRARASSGD